MLERQNDIKEIKMQLITILKKFFSGQYHAEWEQREFEDCPIFRNYEQEVQDLNKRLNRILKEKKLLEMDKIAYYEDFYPKKEKGMHIDTYMQEYYLKKHLKNNHSFTCSGDVA